MKNKNSFSSEKMIDGFPLFKKNRNVSRRFDVSYQLLQFTIVLLSFIYFHNDVGHNEH